MSTRHMYVTIDVTFFEEELFFLPSHTSQGETTTDENYGWFDMPAEYAGPNKGDHNCLLGDCPRGRVASEESPYRLVSEQIGQAVESQECPDGPITEKINSLSRPAAVVSLNDPNGLGEQPK
ncbi:hypothetical protein FF1_040321 [Malus domestica]